MFINEFALTSEQRAGLYFALGCSYGEHYVEYPVLREEATYNAFREWIDALTTYHVCVTGANSKLDYAVAVVRSYIMFCYSVTPPELVPDLRDILDKTWSRPIVLTQHHDDNEVTVAVEMLGSVALMDLQRLTMQPVEYNMGDERYDDLSIQTILEDGISEVNFKDRFARANMLCAKLAMENIQDAKEKMNEVLRITG